MTIQELGAIGELIGSVGVIVTLVYLAMQIRSNTNATQGSTELDIGRELAEWTARMTSDLRLQNIYDRITRHEEVTAEEAYTYVWAQSGYFFLCEGWYRQYRRGLIPRSSWDPIAQSLVAILKVPYMSSWWDNRATPFSEEFRNHLEELRQDDAYDYVLPDMKPFMSKQVKPSD